MTEILFPVGRMIGGSMYNSQPRTDANGQPVLNSQGQPETQFSFGCAIPKTGEQHWSQTSWGSQIKAIGDAAYPGQSQSPTFAWKIIDGDSTIPNKRNNRPCDQEGYAGNWVLWFSQGWAPKLVDVEGRDSIEPEYIMPGYFIQVYGSVVANKPRPGKSHTPGIYLNPLAIARIAYGERIQSNNVDLTNVKFGGALPPGASQTPVAGSFNPAPTNHQAQPAPTPPPPPPNYAVLGKQMTPLANGASYDAFIKQGWTDEMLIQNGYMVG